MFTMLLVATASVVGISVMYQPTNVESQPQQKILATVNGVTVYASSDGKACKSTSGTSPLVVTEELMPRRSSLWYAFISRDL